MDTSVDRPGLIGRRVRNMRDKQERIAAAAARLFVRDGFEKVTVAQIAKDADIAAGTLFRYAASKAELLMMVYNEHFHTAIEVGARQAKSVDDPTAAILAMVDPVIGFASSHTGNALAYQRELLFGTEGEQYRAEGLHLVHMLQDAIASRLVARVSPTPEDASGVQQSADRAARSVFAVLQLLLARLSATTDWDAGARDELEEQVGQIVCGFLVTTCGATQFANENRTSR